MQFSKGLQLEPVVTKKRQNYLCSHLTKLICVKSFLLLRSTVLNVLGISTFAGARGEHPNRIA